MGLGGGGVAAFLTNVLPGVGDGLSFFKLAFLPSDEKNPPVDLVADIGNGIGRDLIEDGGDVTVEPCVELRVIGAREG